MLITIHSKMIVCLWTVKGNLINKNNFVFAFNEYKMIFVLITKKRY